MNEVKVLLDSESRIFHKECLIKVYGVVVGHLPVHLSDFFNVGDYSYAIGIAMRYEKGGSLNSLIHPKDGQPSGISTLEKIRILSEIAHGLAELHSVGVVHGDIKPDNILLSNDSPPIVRLADFGLASLRDSSIIGQSTLVETSHQRGTPIYCAPEMLINVHSDEPTCGVAKPSRKTDMYAFSILMWEVMTEKRPFETIKDEVTLCSFVHQGGRPTLSDISSEFPDKIKNLVSASWGQKRSDRKTAIECFASLQYCHGFLAKTTYDVYVLSHPGNANMANFVFHRLTQKGLKFEQCNEMTSLLGVTRAKLVVACLTEDFQNDEGCQYEVKHARDLSPVRSVVALFLQGNRDDWCSGATYYTCQLRDESTVTFDVSSLVSEPSWSFEDGPIPSITREFNSEIDRMAAHIRQIIG